MHVMLPLSLSVAAPSCDSTNAEDMTGVGGAMLLLVVLKLLEMRA